MGELKGAGFLGDNGTLVYRFQLRNKLGDKSAGFLGVEVTNFLRNINKRSDNFVMTLLSTLLKCTSSSTDLYRKLLTSSVSHKLAWLFLHILGGAGRLIHSLAHLLTLTIAHLLSWLVALSHCLVESFLLEGDLTGLLKVFFANFFL